MPRIYAKQELEERYKKLPEVLKDVMFSPEVAEKMFEIGKKNGLTIEKTGFMAEETGFVILGLTQPQKFVDILSDRLDADRNTASKIASDINHAVFFPLRETLKSTHDIEVGETQLHSPAAEIIRPSGGARPPAAAPPLMQQSMPSSPSMPSGPAIRRTPPPPLPSRPQMQPGQETAAPPAPALEKKSDAVVLPLIPGFVSRPEAEKIVAAEKEKRQMPPYLPPQPRPALPSRVPALVDLRMSPQQIPRSSTPPPQSSPEGKLETKNEIDLRPMQRQETNGGKEETGIAQEKLISGAPAQTRQMSVPPKTSPAPPPIIIPPNPQTVSDPLKDIPQNPKIPPIDLRAAPKSASVSALPAQKMHAGHDPYREPVE